MTFIRKYYIEQNFDQLFDNIRGIRDNIAILSAIINKTIENSNEKLKCLFELRDNVKKIQKNPFVKSFDNMLLEVKNIVEKHAYYLGMYGPFAM